MKNILILFFLLAFVLNAIGQHETPGFVSIPHPIIVFKNSDSSLTLKIKMAGVKCTLSPMCFSKPYDVTSIPKEGGYRIWLVNGKETTELINENVADGSEYYSDRSTYVAVISYNTAKQKWQVIVRKPDPTQGEQPKQKQ